MMVMVTQVNYLNMLASLLMSDAAEPRDKTCRDSVMVHTCFSFNYPYKVGVSDVVRIATDMWCRMGDIKYLTVADDESTVKTLQDIGINAVWGPTFTRSLVDQSGSHIAKYGKIFRITRTNVGESIEWLIGGNMIRSYKPSNKYISIKLDLE